MEKNKILKYADEALFFVSTAVLIFHMLHWFSSPGIVSHEGILLSMSAAELFKRSVLLLPFRLAASAVSPVYGLRILSLGLLMSIVVLSVLRKKERSTLVVLAALMSAPQLNVHVRIFSFIHLSFLYYLIYDAVRGNTARKIIAGLSVLVSPYMPFLLMMKDRNAVIYCACAVSAGASAVLGNAGISPATASGWQVLFAASPAAAVLILTIFFRNRGVLPYMLFGLAAISPAYHELPPACAMPLYLFLFASLKADLKGAPAITLSAVSVLFFLSGFVGFPHFNYTFDYTHGQYITMNEPQARYADIGDLPDIRERAVSSPELSFLKKNYISFPEMLAGSININTVKYLIFDDFLLKMLNEDPSRFRLFDKFNRINNSGRIYIYENGLFFLNTFADYINDRLSKEKALVDTMAAGLIKGECIDLADFMASEKNSEKITRIKFILIADFMLREPSHASVLYAIKERMEYENWVKEISLKGYTLYRNPRFR